MKLKELLVIEGCRSNSITAIARAVECQRAGLRSIIFNMMVVSDVLAEVIFALEAVRPSVPVRVSFRSKMKRKEGSNYLRQ